jgi:hypothetical protein
MKIRMSKQIWTPEQAWGWRAACGWLRGSDFIPSTAVNQLEMWQSDTFDPKIIDAELSLAESLGWNCMRVYLHHVAWEVDRDGFKLRVRRYLDISSGHGILTIFVFFDDCWNASYAAGPQPAPVPGVHNSGWVRDPGDLLFADSGLIGVLEDYVKDILTAFRDDDRIAIWDLYNEPGNSRYENRSMDLLHRIFEWAWQIRPSQPLSAGIWSANLVELSQFQLESSDVITYHNYCGPEDHQADIDRLKKIGRPLVCTEYMARRNNSLFSNILPILKREGVGAINWGLVTGKTNTKYAWEEPIAGGAEPGLWFHDIFWPGGKPYSQEEVDLIRSLTQ